MLCLTCDNQKRHRFGPVKSTQACPLPHSCRSLWWLAADGWSPPWWWCWQLALQSRRKTCLSLVTEKMSQVSLKDIFLDFVEKSEICSVVFVNGIITLSLQSTPLRKCHKLTSHPEIYVIYCHWKVWKMFCLTRIPRAVIIFFLLESSRICQQPDWQVYWLLFKALTSERKRLLQMTKDQ